MLMAHLKRKANGHLVKSASGHLVRDCGCCCSCGCEGEPCEFCCATPDQWVLTISGVQLPSSCLTCSLAGSMTVGAGTNVNMSNEFGGTWTLTQDPLDPCCWVYDGDGSEVEVTTYSTTDCSGAGNQLDGFHIRLCKTSLTAFSLIVYLDSSTQTGGADLFNATMTVGDDLCCPESLTTSNAITDWQCSDPPSSSIGKNGGAVLTPCNPA